MKHILCWLIALLGALPLLAQSPAPGELILLDDKGAQVLRLAPDDSTTGLQRVPAGRYLLKIQGSAPFELLVGSDTRLEVKHSMELPSGGELGPPEAGDIPAVIDFDLEPGDQQQRLALADGPGVRVELQLTGSAFPQFYGWSAVIEYDPQQVQYVGGSFQPSALIPGLVPLVDDKLEARIEVGGADFAKHLVSGDGDLGILAFETLSDFTGQTELKLVELKLLTPAGTRIVQLAAAALIASDPSSSRAKKAILSGQAAIDHLLAEKACPGCDLRKAQLLQADLTGADLTGADLTDANLFRANLTEAILAKAVLRTANLLQTELGKADLTGADLTDARLISARLQAADLTDAIIDGAKLSGADFTDAIWIDGTTCGRGSIGRCKR